MSIQKNNLLGGQRLMTLTAFHRIFGFEIARRVLKGETVCDAVGNSYCRAQPIAEAKQ